MPCFLLPVSAAAVAVTWASASAATFSVIIRVVSASALAPPWAIRKHRRNTTACASQHILAAPSDSANDAFHGHKGSNIKGCRDKFDEGNAIRIAAIQGVRAALNCFRTAAAELPTRSIARANSSLVTPRCRVQYLTCSSCSIAILLRSGVTVLLIIFAGLVINGVASGLFRLTGIQRWAAAGRRKTGCQSASTVEPAARFSEIKSCMRVSNIAQK
jgi:hypothetical protein